MSVNRFQPHVWLIAEDDANRQLANGFLLHDDVAARRVGKTSVAGGWTKVIEVFEDEYIPLLNQYSNAHVVMLVDFDGREDRGAQLMAKVPNDLKCRVFVLGSKDTPEALRGEVGLNLEETGSALADDCRKDTAVLWRHPHLVHNEPELNRLLKAIKPILFLA